MLDKQRDRHSEPDENCDSPDGGAPYFTRGAGSCVAAGNRAQRHHADVGPLHHFLGDEINRRQRVDCSAQQIFEAVHLVDVGHAQNAERRQH